MQMRARAKAGGCECVRERRLVDANACESEGWWMRMRAKAKAGGCECARKQMKGECYVAFYEIIFRKYSAYSRHYCCISDSGQDIYQKPTGLGTTLNYIQFNSE
jgi:hypothetical protein